MIERNLDLCKAVLEGLRLFLAGKEYGVSSGIDGSITYGYGELDEFGFWEYPVWEGLIELGRASALKAELARVNKLNDTLVGERNRLREALEWYKQLVYGLCDDDSVVWTDAVQVAKEDGGKRARDAQNVKPSDG